MGENYHCWDVRVEDFDALPSETERLRFFAWFGLFTPSRLSIKTVFHNLSLRARL